MGTHIHEVRNLQQNNVDLIWSVFMYAITHEYDRESAKRVALYALERRRQGGYQDFAKAIDAIRRNVCKASRYNVADFNRLVSGRTVSDQRPDVDIDGPFEYDWQLVCNCDRPKHELYD